MHGLKDCFAHPVHVNAGQLYDSAVAAVPPRRFRRYAGRPHFTNVMLLHDLHKFEGAVITIAFAFALNWRTTCPLQAVPEVSGSPCAP